MAVLDWLTLLFIVLAVVACVVNYAAAVTLNHLLGRAARALTLSAVAVLALVFVGTLAAS